jgi:hypothetical protein
MFSLAYLPAAERLTIIVMKARNLSRIGADKKPPGMLFYFNFYLKTKFYFNI